MIETKDISIAIMGNFWVLNFDVSNRVHIIVGKIISPVKLSIHSISINWIYLDLLMYSVVIVP